jgi:hypothetical protein
MKWIERIFIVDRITVSHENKTMREENEDRVLIRRFLLGELDEEERQRIEELFMVDGDYRETVLTVEGELIESYLEGSLSEPEGKMFAERFLSTPGRRRQVQVTRAMKRYAAVEVASHSPPAAEEPPKRRPEPMWRQSLGGWLTTRARVVYVTAAALIIAAVLGGLWAAYNRRPVTRLTPEEAQRLEVERELAGLNDAAGRARTPPGAHVFSTALPPVSPRAAASSFNVPLRDGADLIELRLLTAGDEYPLYRGTLRRVGGANAYAIPGLRVESTPDGRAVPVRIRAGLLTHGLYQVTLSGVTADGRLEGAGEYTFQAGD